MERGREREREMEIYVEGYMRRSLYIEVLATWPRSISIRKEGDRLID
jgi:hypothetical protein